MKKITCLIIAFLLSNVYAFGQCKTNIQNSTNPVVSADNSGAVTPF